MPSPLGQEGASRVPHKCVCVCVCVCVCHQTCCVQPLAQTKLCGSGLMQTSIAWVPQLRVNHNIACCPIPKPRGDP